MNILILIAGEPRIQAMEAYPTALVEINGVPLVQRQLAECAKIPGHRIIVAMQKKDLARYHLDEVVRLLSPEAAVVSVEDKTEGAACTALLAAGYIDNDQPLLILNGDEFLTVPFDGVIQNFVERELDGGTMTFKSVHPRYSFVRLDDQNMVVEAAEKHPISDNATAGFYYFRQGRDFVRAAKNAIRKDARHNNMFYVCPVYNEMVLEGKKIGIFPINAKDFHPIKSDRQLIELSVTEGDK
ncbi:glycosyltransferase family 2 protein [Rhizobium metallidurans]|uniref:dTDP-glucose pyrophosphorylase n=1 Tax=Rhizobium metallidurans TaxID=1265931 RepID=A0A7W6CPZ5_9HYPH|nr:glycosyltransferase family 2 protein [Rhizobium metallidurans]MBB3965072.1 dTDP-glucose pyrophosphorylase [Rhizobium metallidurans]